MKYGIKQQMIHMSIENYCLVFLGCKQVKEHKKNEWKMGLYSCYYVYGVLYSRLESK